MSVDRKRLRILRRFQLALLITPYVRLNLVYKSYQFVYFNKYLSIKTSLIKLVDNDVDRDICQPYIKLANQFNKSDFITIYAMICRTLYERNKRGITK